MKMIEVKLEVIVSDNLTIDDVRSNIKDSLDENINIDLTHIRVKVSEKKAKEWIIDKNRKLTPKHFNYYK